MTAKRKQTVRLVGEKGEQGIGTLNEGSLHGALKAYIAPDPSHWEIRIGNSVCDIVRDGEIFEIQTRNFRSIKKKLALLLETNVVTVVYPIVKEKRVYWVEPDTGEINGGRLSPRKGKNSDVLRELVALGELASHKNLRLRLISVKADEYKYKNGWSEDKKRGATRMDRVVTDICDDCTFAPEEFIKLLPEGLVGKFTAKEASKLTNLKPNVMSSALLLFTKMEFVKRVGRDKRGYVYEINSDLL